MYEGDNVTICLLASGVFLFSLHRRTHLLFGMFSYDWIHCLLLFDSLNVSFIELHIIPHTVLISYYQKEFLHYSFLLTKFSFIFGQHLSF